MITITIIISKSISYNICACYFIIGQQKSLIKNTSYYSYIRKQVFSQFIPHKKNIEKSLSYLNSHTSTNS